MTFSQKLMTERGHDLQQEGRENKVSPISLLQNKEGEPWLLGSPYILPTRRYVAGEFFIVIIFKFHLRQDFPHFRRGHQTQGYSLFWTENIQLLSLVC